MTPSAWHDLMDRAADQARRTLKRPKPSRDAVHLAAYVVALAETRPMEKRI